MHEGDTSISISEKEKKNKKKKASQREKKLVKWDLCSMNVSNYHEEELTREKAKP